MLTLNILLNFDLAKDLGLRLMKISFTKILVRDIFHPELSPE